MKPYLEPAIAATSAISAYTAWITENHRI